MQLARSLLRLLQRRSQRAGSNAMPLGNVSLDNVSLSPLGQRIQRVAWEQSCFSSGAGIFQWCMQRPGAVLDG